MLILSRREQDKIIFPSLGISIEVIKIQGNRTSLGIDAPKEVRIARHELLDEDELTAIDSGTFSGGLSTQYADKIDQAKERLQLATELITGGDTDEGLTHLAIALNELGEIGTKKSEYETAVGSVNETGSEYACENASPTAKQERVLLIDDNPATCREIAAELQDQGIQVEHADNGLAAIYALSSPTPPDRVLINSAFPETAVEETISRLTRISPAPNVPIQTIGNAKAAVS